MNRMMALLATAFLASVALEAAAGPPHGRGPGAKGDAMCVYDVKTVETITGTVEKVERLAMGPREGVHLVLRTRTETVSVHLGPAWFIDNQTAAIAVADSIEVRGSRIVFEGAPAILAATVTRGDEVLLLREDDGTPRWSGWRKRGMRTPM